MALPPELWSSPEGPDATAAAAWQAHELDRLITTYAPFRVVELLAEGRVNTAAFAARAALAALSRVDALRTLKVSRLGADTQTRAEDSRAALDMAWSVLMNALSDGLSAGVHTLRLDDARLPGPTGLDAVARLKHVRHLHLSTAAPDYLHQQHVAAISAMPSLHSLELSFRASGGTLVAPLTLDALGALSGLTRLELSYTGAGIKYVSGTHGNHMTGSKRHAEHRTGWHSNAYTHCSM